MDKYEYNIKSDKIKKLVERKDYETAVKIADTIDWERVRNIKMLSTVSLAYEKMSRFEEAKDLLLMAYECAPVGRRFLYKLTELATKQGEYDEAEDYLKEFAATSPQDPSRLILRYEISKAKGEPTERLITILETYQKREFEEKWSYELANLYYRVGKNDECVKLCDEIVLWFGVGTYVDKAMELKQRIAPLTPDQIEKRENKEKYLRRLEEVQKEFEDRYRVLEEPTKAAVEAVVNQVEVPVVEAAVEEIVVEEREESLVECAAEEDSAEENSTEEMPAEEISTEEPLEEKDLYVEDEAVEALVEDAVEASLEEAVMEESIEGVLTEMVEEMETSLAREIEAAALTAALNEVMLRETAATMESMEVVVNDHSQEQESTKVAVVRVSMQDKTREFVREAKVINVILEEAPHRVVTEEEVEARLQEELPAEVPVVEEIAETETSAEEILVEEIVEEEILPEESAEEEKSAEKMAVDEATEEDVAAEEVLAVKEIEEEVSVEISAVEKIEEETSSVTTAAVLDHYVLMTCCNEAEGVKECVAYIRRMRELLGYPVTQVAKIQGAKLATKNMAQTLRKLQGRDLVVVGICDLPDEMLNQTVEIMAEDTIESFIALIGTENEITSLQERQAFFAGCRVLSVGEEEAVLAIPEMVEEEAVQEKEESLSLEEEQSMLAKLVEEALHASLFSEETNSEEVPVVEDPGYAWEEEIVYVVPAAGTKKQVEKESISEGELTPKAFYECAVQYAHMMDAKVDEMGGLAIYAAAEEYQQERQPLTEELAQELVDNAIQKAERRTLKSLFSNRYDKDGFLILKEQHFKD